MLAKQFKGRNFHGALSYVLGKEGAKTIGGNLPQWDAAALNHEFTQVSLKRPNLKRSVYHCALSLPPGETLSDGIWRNVARDYLDAMGFDHSQFVLVRHTDTESHQHVHIVANRVGIDGKTVPDSFDHYRAQNVVRAIEESYNLRPVLPSWKSSRKALSLRQLKQEAETGIPSVQRLLQDGITEALQNSLSLPDLVDRLQQRNIKTHAFYGRQNRLQGLAYEMDGVVMSGTSLGYSYQVGGLIQQLEQKSPGASAIALHSPEQIDRSRKAIIASIQGAAFDQPRLPVLLDRLQDEGIETHVQFAKVGRYGKRVKQIQYRSGGIGFQASDLGKDYTLQGLQSIGVQYDPTIDDATIDRQQRTENIMRVTIKNTVDDTLRDRSLERLMQLLQQLAAEGHWFRSLGIL
jgi:Relaxase/Mobilisation nuclease domain